MKKIRILVFDNQKFIRESFLFSIISLDLSLDEIERKGLSVKVYQIDQEKESLIYQSK